MDNLCSHSEEEDEEDDGDGSVFRDSRETARSDGDSTTVHEKIVEQDSLGITYHAARLIRQLCHDQPCFATDTSTAHAEDSIPDLMFNFYAWLLSGAHEHQV